MSHYNRKVTIYLWVAQTLLALLFVFAGSMKFIMPVAAMQQGPVVFSGTFLHFIGVAEVLGGLGLVLPGLFQIHQYLTPLAAAGLALIMAGATIVSAIMSMSMAIVPCVVGVVAVTIWRGRGGFALLHRRAGATNPLATDC